MGVSGWLDVPGLLGLRLKFASLTTERNRTMYSILVIDDEILRIQPIIDELNKESNLTIEIAERVGDAVDILQGEQKIDAILLDVIMPFDKRVSFHQEDWNGLTQDIGHTGVALYNFLTRCELIKGIPALVLTHAPVGKIKNKFKTPTGAGFDIGEKATMLPSEVLIKLKQMMRV